MAKTIPVALLFDEECEDQRYPEVHFLEALKEVDPQLATHSRVLRGSLLIHGLCYKPSRVSASPANKGNGPRAKYRTSSLETRGDKKLLATLIGDLTDSILEQWHTLNETELWSHIANKSLSCIVLPSLPDALKTELDQALRLTCSAYLGATSPDFANPLQQHLFAESLFEDAFISKGSVFMTLEFDGNFEGSFYGADAFSQRGIVKLTPEQFEAQCPALDMPTELSARGLLSAMRVKNRTALNVHERLAKALSAYAVRQSDIELDWDIKQLPNSTEEVEVQSGKLVDYLLNLDHKDGGSKAKFFEQELEICSKDSVFLKAQLIDTLSNASLINARLNQHGMQFEAMLPIKGINGRTAIIKTAWIVRPGERASLVTAFPSKKDDQLELQAQAPALVDELLKGAARWQAIFELASEAGHRAAAACVPTPMKIAGGELIMEGECGGGYVNVRDARKGFARWLKTSKNGTRGYPSGISVYAATEGQSVDRAMAYSEAFATVLSRNGIEATAQKYYT